jgi:Na+-driven multidrug efflux pump
MAKMKEVITDPKKLSLFAVTWPIFIEMLMLMLLGNIDVLMLSQYSDEAVAGVGVANQMMQMSVVMFGFVSAGAAIIISQYIGAKKNEDAKRVSMVAIILALIFGLVVSAFFVTMRFPILRLMISEDYLLPFAGTMVLIVGGFIFIQAVLLTTGAILRSHGFTRDMLVVTVTMNIFNAAGNALVIFGLFGLPVFGVQGVAVVTAFSKLLGLSIAFYLLNKRIPGIFRTISRKVGFPFHYVKSILRVGVPAAGENLSFQAYQLVMISLIGTIGTTALTTKIYTRSVNFFVLLATVSIGQGASIILGQLMGAKEYDVIYKRALNYLKYGVIASICVATVFLIFNRPIM